MKIKFYFFPNKNFNIFLIKTSIYYYNLLKNPRLLFVFLLPEPVTSQREAVFWDCSDFGRKLEVLRLLSISRI